MTRDTSILNFRQKARSFMKKATLVTLPIIHILLSIILFFLGKQYVFTVFIFNYWIPMLLTGIVLLIIFTFKDSKTIHKMRNVIFFSYSIGLLIITLFIIYETPQYSYKDASNIIEKRTGQITIEPNKGQVKGQHEHYYIYTNTQTYLFNALTGDFVESKK